MASQIEMDFVVVRNVMILGDETFKLNAGKSEESEIDRTLTGLQFAAVKVQ